MTLRLRATLLTTAAAAVLTLLSPSVSAAAPLDCTAGCNTSYAGALWTTTDNQSTGTGVIQSFVRISAASQDVVEGHNTDGRPLAYDENTSPTFTRDLLLASVPIVTLNGVTYYEFLLDINQTSADPLLSLNRVQICTSNTGDLVDTGGSAVQGCPGTLVYNLDAAADNTVELNYNLNSGSGSGDLFMYIPTSLFDPTQTYVYLYSSFGVPNNNNDGFEEWAIRTPAGAGGGAGTGGGVPEPASIALFGLAMLGIGHRMRARRLSSRS